MSELGMQLVDLYATLGDIADRWEARAHKAERKSALYDDPIAQIRQMVQADVLRSAARELRALKGASR